MDRPGESRSVAEFLAALVDELAAAPDEVTSYRHISAAAATARGLVTASKTFRWVAAATAMVTALGTGGVAMAGGLPDPIQTAVADAARVLPLPIAVPYPHARLSDPVPVEHPEVDTWSRSAPAEAMASQSEDSGEAPAVIAAGVTSSEHSQLAVTDRSDRLSCESDGDRRYEGKGRDSVCDQVVAPPGFDQDVDWSDRDHDEDRDEEFGDRDHESRADKVSEARDADSDQRGHDESDRQEERHDHESPDDDSSTGRD